MSVILVPFKSAEHSWKMSHIKKHNSSGKWNPDHSHLRSLFRNVLLLIKIYQKLHMRLGIFLVWWWQRKHTLILWCFYPTLCWAMKQVGNSSLKTLRLNSNSLHKHSKHLHFTDTVPTLTAAHIILNFLPFTHNFAEMQCTKEMGVSAYSWENFKVILVDAETAPAHLRNND